MLASNGKVFTLEAAKLPGGRGFGDPIRLMVDFDDGTEIVAALPYQPGTKLLVAASDGRGFLAPADALVANTRKGKGIMASTRRPPPPCWCRRRATISPCAAPTG